MQGNDDRRSGQDRRVGVERRSNWRAATALIPPTAQEALVLREFLATVQALLVMEDVENLLEARTIVERMDAAVMGVQDRLRLLM